MLSFKLFLTTTEDKHKELFDFETELLEQKFDIIGTFSIDAQDKNSNYNLNSSYGNTCNAVYIIGKYLSKAKL